MRKISDRIKALPQGVKASFGFFFANIVTKGIAYLTTPIYTRMLTTEQYGKASLFFTWVTTLGILAMFSLSDGVFNNGMLDHPDRRDEYSFSMLILSNVITLVFSAVLLGLYPLIKQWLGLELPLVILMLVIFLLQPARSFWTARQQYEMKYKASVLWSLILAFASPMCAVVCIYAFPGSRLYARLFGAESVLIAAYIGFYIYLWIKSAGKVNTRYWKPAFLFNLPLIPHYLSTNLLNSADRLMISNLVSDSATAYYTVAYSVAAVANIVWMAMNASLIPFTYEKCTKKDYAAVSNVVLPILTAFGAICVFIIMLAPEVVAVMASGEYMRAIYVIPPIVGGVFFQVQYFIYANIIYFYKKPKYVMYASVTAMALNIVLNYIFIPMYGYAAAGYTTIFCYFVQSVMDYFAMRKVVAEKVYNMRYIGALTLGVTAVSLLSGFVYDYFILRYVVIALILAGCVVFRKRIMDAVSSVRKKDARESG